MLETARLSPIRDNPDLTMYGYDRKELVWRARAACDDKDPELFFPKRGASTAEARAICQECPSRLPCLDAALKRNEQMGMWGGYVLEQRREIRKLLRNGISLREAVTTVDNRKRKRRARGTITWIS